jgi:hypothetical protein
MSNKFQLNDQIRHAISISSYSDSGLAEILEVGRDTVYRWRTGSTTIIRRQNLVKLAEALGHYIKYNDKGVVEFIPQNPIKKNNLQPELSNLSGDDMTSLIQTMQKQIEYLLEENTQLKIKIKGHSEKKP